jgi:methylenetetrahydrofolate dehydrogenase (NADP+)/methenyltetrahydrofolate cyclohydrolase
VRRSIEQHVAAGGKRPGLAVVLVGNDPASSIYVRAKRRDCERAGIVARDVDLPASTSQAELLDLIARLDADPAINGILVQLPLPVQIEETAVTNSINPDKDVDGFHAFNVGKLALRQPGLRPCTPRGVMALLHFYGIANRSMHAVVVGASNIVGRPMALELLLTGSTVTVSHRFTRNLEEHVCSAELLIAPSAVIIRVDSRGDRRRRGHQPPAGRAPGRRHRHFAAAARRASWISPVPGGVGPMTRATLMLNTAEAAACRGAAYTPQPRG